MQVPIAVHDSVVQASLSLQPASLMHSTHPSEQIFPSVQRQGGVRPPTQFPSASVHSALVKPSSGAGSGAPSHVAGVAVRSEQHDPVWMYTSNPRSTGEGMMTGVGPWESARNVSPGTMSTLYRPLAPAGMSRTNLAKGFMAPLSGIGKPGSVMPKQTWRALQSPLFQI